MDWQTALAEIDRRLECERQRLAALTQANLGYEYFDQFRRHPDFSLGNDVLAEKIVADRRRRGMATVQFK